MAVLKQIKFGTGAATPIAQTVVTAANESVLSVTGTNTDLSDDANPSYAVDLNIDGTTLTKDTTNAEQAVLKVGTVPAAQVSVAAGGHNPEAVPADNKTFVGDDVEEVLLELNQKIEQTGNTARTYTLVDDTEHDETVPTNVLKRYRLQETIGAQTPTLVGANIDIPKDSSLKEVYLGASTDTIDAETGEITKNTVTDPQSMNFAYQLVDGTYSLTKIDVSKFLTESEFGDGLSVSGAGVVSVNAGNGLGFDSSDPKKVQVVVDSTSEKDSQTTSADFLTVGADGIKVQGIKDEIDRKIAALDVTDAAVTGQYVSQVSETDGKIAVVRTDVSGAPLNNYTKGTQKGSIVAADTINQAFSKIEVNIEENERTTAAALTDLNSRIEAMDKAASAVAGQVVTTVAEADGVVSETKANVKDLQLGGYLKDTSATGDIGGTDTINTALSKLENKIAAAADDHTVVVHAQANTHVTVSGAANANGGMTYTVSETNIADADDLAAEITRAQTAEGEIAGKIGLTGSESSRTFTPTTNYGTGSTTIVGNMQALDTKLKEVADGLAAVQYKVNGTTLEFYGMTSHA